MKILYNFWSFVIVCFKFRFIKVYNYFENLEKMLVDLVLLCKEYVCLENIFLINIVCVVVKD